MIAQGFCKFMGAVFIIIAVWGFIAGDRVMMFHVNTAHNWVHLASGIGAIICGIASERAARLFCVIFGAVYGLVAILGFAGVAQVVDLLHLNTPDNWLHAVIALMFLAAGLASVARVTPHSTRPNSRPKPA